MINHWLKKGFIVLALLASFLSVPQFTSHSVQVSSDSYSFSENFLVPSAYAAGEDVVNPGSGIKIEDPERINSDIPKRPFGEVVTDIVNYFLGFLGFIAVIVFIYAGVLWVLSGGNEDMITKAKTIMTYAALGILVIILSFSIVSFLTSSAGSACEDNTDCEGTTTPYCSSQNQCVECIGDGNCPTGSTCSAGRCIRSICTTNADCSAGYLCLDDPLGGKSCQLDIKVLPCDALDCTFGEEYCGIDPDTDELACLPFEIKMPCVIDGDDCPDNYLCKQITDKTTSCVYNYETSPCYKHDCSYLDDERTGEYGRCTLNEEGEAECDTFSPDSAVCDVDADCPRGYQCLPYDKGTPDTADDINTCQYSYADLPCFGVECPDGQFCSNSICQPWSYAQNCSNPSGDAYQACARDYSCQTSDLGIDKCVYNPTLIACYGVTCEFGTEACVDGTCVPTPYQGRACSASKPCPTDYECTDGRCYYQFQPFDDLPCSSTEPCPSTDYTCTDGFCKYKDSSLTDRDRQCTYNEDCGTNQYCSQAGYCLEAGTIVDCDTDSDCDDGKSCHILGFCYDPDSSGGSSCDDRSDCPSGNFICNPQTDQCEPGGTQGGDSTDSQGVSDDSLNNIDDTINDIGDIVEGLGDDIDSLSGDDEGAIRDILGAGTLDDKISGIMDLADKTDDPAVLAVLERVLYVLERYNDLREELDNLREVMPESEDTIQAWDNTSESLDSLIDDPLSGLKFNRFTKRYRELKELINKFPVVLSRIKATPSTGNVPFTVTLDGMDSIDPTGGTISDYKWSYLDNTGNLVSLANSPQIVHKFTEPNTYAVRLQVSTAQKDAAGYRTAMDGVSTMLIRANPPASKVAFRINGVDVTDVYHVTLQEANAGITFDPSVTVPALGRSITKYEWSYGDASSEQRSVPATVVHNYKDSGEYFVTLKTTDNHGVKDSTTIKLFIKSVAADIRVRPLDGNVNTEFYFEGVDSRSDDGVIMKYKWEIEDGDGEVVYEDDHQSFYHTFSSPGDYKTILTVTDSAGDQDKYLKLFTIDSRAPVAGFIYDIPKSNHPNLFEFNAIGSYDPDEGDTIVYSWDFDGDGDYDVIDTSDIRVTHEYTRVGEYRATLQVKDSFGRRTQIEKPVSVQSVLSGDILPSISAANVGAELAFKVDSPKAVAYLWEFGDGETDSADQPTTTHVYSKKGKYRVKVHFFDEKDNSNFDQAYVLIGDTDSPVAFAEARINGRDVSMVEDLCGNGKPGYRVSRTDNLLFSSGKSVNRDGTGRLLSYNWKITDGTQSTQKEFAHRFTELSSDGSCYSAELSVRDQISGKISDKDTIYFKVENQLPTLVDFVVSPEVATDELMTPAKIRLRAVSPKDADGQIKRYRWWYFQEGNESEKLGVHSTTSPETEIIVTARGLPDITNRYFFVLEITDSDNQVYNTFQRFGELSALEITNGPNLSPVAEFTVDKTTISVGDSITFVSQSYDPQGETLPNDAYMWDFNGDGDFDDVSSGAQVNRQFNTPGEYTARLKVVHRGLSSTVSKTIYVEQVDSLPQAAFTYTVDGNTVSFDADSSRYDPSLADKTLRFEWDFDIQDDQNGNGISDDDVEATGVTTSYTYSEPGIYRVRLKVKDSLGMENVVVRDVNLNLTDEERNKSTYNSIKISSPGKSMTTLDVSVSPIDISKGDTVDINARVFNADNSPYYGKIYFEVMEGGGNLSPNPVYAKDSRGSTVFTATDSGMVRIRVRATGTYYGDVMEEIILNVK